MAPTKLLNFIDSTASKQFTIPIYQRPYSWEEKHCKQLWDDIYKVGDSKHTTSHFMGSILAVRKPSAFERESFDRGTIIDGQQRIITLSLLLIALRNELQTNRLNGLSEDLEKIQGQILQNKYLINQEKQGEDKYRLKLFISDDKKALNHLIDDYKKEDEIDTDKTINTNFRFFENHIDTNKEKLETILRGLSRLEIVGIILNEDYHNPQAVFESMNSTGKTLSKADLIRNYVFMQLPLADQTHLYEQYWKPAQDLFGIRYDEHFEKFMRTYLAMKTKKRIKNDNVYEEFRLLYNDTNQVVEDFLKNLKTYAKRYCYIATIQEEENHSLRRLFKALKILKSEQTYPFLLACYTHHIDTPQELIKIVQLIVSYIFRRSICRIPATGLNGFFISLIQKAGDFESIKSQLLDQKIAFIFPHDDEFRGKLLGRDIYDKTELAKYLLVELENHLRGGKGKITEEEYTIEHIMPQNLNQWEEDLNNNPEWENWEEEHKEYLHKLGNLTLTAYNSELSNQSFTTKREHNKHGFLVSGMRLDEYMRNEKCTKWGKNQINERGEILAEHALKIWIRPEQLSKPNKQKVSPQKNEIENTITSAIKKHPFTGKASEHIYKAIDTAIKDLIKIEKSTENPNYIAYNIEDKITLYATPSYSYLNLYFQFDDIAKLKPYDKDNRLESVSRKSHAGDGNTQITIKSSDKKEIDTCIDLIKQALAQKEIPK